MFFSTLNTSHFDFVLLYLLETDNYGNQATCSSRRLFFFWFFFGGGIIILALHKDTKKKSICGWVGEGNWRPQYKYTFSSEFTRMKPKWTVPSRSNGPARLIPLFTLYIEDVCRLTRLDVNTRLLSSNPNVSDV